MIILNKIIFFLIFDKKEFDDKYTLAKCHYLLGKIAIYDCNFIEARNYALSAQVILFIIRLISIYD